MKTISLETYLNMQMQLLVVFAQRLKTDSLLASVETSVNAAKNLTDLMLNKNETIVVEPSNGLHEVFRQSEPTYVPGSKTPGDDPPASDSNTKDERDAMIVPLEALFQEDFLHRPELTEGDHQP